jgi:hypothetical protein
VRRLGTGVGVRGGGTAVAAALTRSKLQSRPLIAPSGCSP